MFAAIADRTEDESVEALIDMVGEQVAGISDYYMNRVEEWDPFAGIEMDMPYQREGKKIGRNDPCPCGSGKKYKNVFFKNKNHFFSCRSSSVSARSFKRA